MRCRPGAPISISPISRGSRCRRASPTSPRRADERLSISRHSRGLVFSAPHPTNGGRGAGRSRANLAMISAGRADGRDEVAPFHSITSSARSRKVSEIFSPNALAVFILTISSNCVGCSTGRSAGLAPFRILST